MPLKFQAEYDADVKRTYDDFKGQSCFDGKCDGKLLSPVDNERAKTTLLICSVCGVGLKKSTYAEFVIRKRVTARAKVRYAKQDIGYIEAAIADARKEIKKKQAEILEKRAEIREGYADLRKWR